ncbi:redoxin [Pacificitalea manganoxidans]|uniref:Redoxin n=1 Tax=Pacificitalea manganoxidans TaxID=1411902 RepID=A0A291M1T7_9RHOB|nr:TlpA disulfide reductase family protein [Pacificitalea manganoxidans]ATI42973.1 redoxin [Pacificitalea manganoxidans]MDR6307104.1 thiol-disulfide isomerase/thioredoxin [Pacificitalea manganoxidans]
MKRLIAAIVYTALGLGAIAAPGAVRAEADIATLEALRDGTMKKLNFHTAPKPAIEGSFLDAGGTSHDMAELRGDVIVLNFWATWCAPCRKEMPMLSALQERFKDRGVRVVTMASGPNPVPAMQRFFEEIGVDNLPLYRDPRQGLSRQFAVLGLPATVILDAEGRELARMVGEADWDSDSAIAILEALAEQPAAPSGDAG